MTEVWLLPDGQGLIHRAKQADLPQIIRLHAENALGQAREDYCDPRFRQVVSKWLLVP